MHGLDEQSEGSSIKLMKSMNNNLELMIVMISKFAVIIVRVTRCVCLDLMVNLKCLLLLLDSRDI